MTKHSPSTLRGNKIDISQELILRQSEKRSQGVISGNDWCTTDTEQKLLFSQPEMLPLSFQIISTFQSNASTSCASIYCFPLQQIELWAVTLWLIQDVHRVFFNYVCHPCVSWDLHCWHSIFQFTSQKYQVGLSCFDPRVGALVIFLKHYHRWIIFLQKFSDVKTF